jgi:hypothetical protein
MRPTLSALVRRVLLEVDDPESGDEHPLHDRAHQVAQRLEDPDALAAASSPETMIGRGGNASVHEIPGEEDLVLRVLKRGAQADRDDPSARRVPNPYGDMNVGQPLASVGHATVLLRQRGEPAGMSSSDPAYRTPDRDRVYAQRIHAAASLSQGAYDRVLADLRRANDLGQIWDPSKSNNVLIDVGGDRLGLVDLSPREPGSQYVNSAGELIVALVGNTHAWRAEESLSPEETAGVQRDRERIIRMASIASARAGVPMSHYYRDRPEEDSSLAYSLKLAGLDRVPVPET